MAVTTGNVVSYEWAVSADGEDWDAIEGEDDDTFPVTPDLLGMYVKVTVIDVDAKVASDVTTSPVAEDTVIGDIEILSAEASKANEVTVTLANPVLKADTNVKLEKNGAAISIGEPGWSDTFDIVTITTDAIMQPGEYTVTLTSETDETNTDSETFEVEAQEINIVILNKDNIVYTNKDEKNPEKAHTEAYAYYDVLNQYGESIRTSTSITWAGSAKIDANKATGQLKLTKTGKENLAWVYGEKIYVTGVHTKTGKSVTKELTVGTEQALDTIDIAGFVKKNTTTLLKTIPAEFRTGEYYLLFNAYDQSGCLLQAGGLTDGDISILPDNVLVISAVKGVQDTPITIGEVDYNAVLVEPGIKVEDGGEVTLKAIALRTGNTKEYHCTVNMGRVVKSFTMLPPEGIVADGDTVKIPFDARDEDGDPITDFVTLAKNKTFNALSFSVGGEGNLILAEDDNGDALLSYVDEQFGWDDARATDGIDRPVYLTAIVVNGDGSNEQLSISDKRRPDGIKKAAFDDVYVEGAEIGLASADLTFIDQYNEVMTPGAAAAFFAANKYTGGSDFAGYHFSVKATYTGNGGLYVDNDNDALTPYKAADKLLTTKEATGWVLSNGKTINNLGFGAVKGVVNAKVWTTQDVTSSRSNEGFKFEIVKAKDGETGDIEKYETTSRSKTAVFTVVDISKIKNFTVGELGTAYLGKDAKTASDEAITADEKISDESLDALHGDALVAFGHPEATGLEKQTDYMPKVTVSGTYGGKEVKIPSVYFTAAGNKVEAKNKKADDAYTWLIDTIIPYDAENAENGLTIQDLYQKTTAQGTWKLGEDTIKAKITTLYADVASGGAINIKALPKEDREVVDTASASIYLSDQAPKPSYFGAFADEYTFNPILTTYNGTYGFGAVDSIDEKLAKVFVYDQYDVKFREEGGDPIGIGEISKKISNIEENTATGYVEDNFTVENNNDPGCGIAYGAERGDTFTLTLIYGTLEDSAFVTIGADRYAQIVDGTNHYTEEDGLKDVLEAQRKAILNIAK